MRTVIALSLVVSLLAVIPSCVVGDESSVDDFPADEDPTGAVQDPDVPADPLATVAPSCMYIQSSWYGACGVKNWSVVSNCRYGYTVRIDIPDFPDTSCKYVGPGQQVTFTSGCAWGNKLAARSIQRC